MGTRGSVASIHGCGLLNVIKEWVKYGPNTAIYCQDGYIRPGRLYTARTAIWDPRTRPLPGTLYLGPCI